MFSSQGNVSQFLEDFCLFTVAPGSFHCNKYGMHCKSYCMCIWARIWFQFFYGCNCIPSSNPLCLMMQSYFCQNMMDASWTQPFTLISNFCDFHYILFYILVTHFLANLIYEKRKSYGHCKWILHLYSNQSRSVPC